MLRFSIVNSDDKRLKVARAKAFLAVPLYRRTCEEFKGKQLPPWAHGLERAFVRFGVAPKQKTAARWGCHQHLRGFEARPSSKPILAIYYTRGFGKFTNGRPPRHLTQIPRR